MCVHIIKEYKHHFMSPTWLPVQIKCIEENKYWIL